MEKQNKKKKIGNLIINILTIVIVLMVLFIVLNWFITRQKGFTSYFGTAYLPVLTDSMDGDKPDSFKEGAVIKVKILDDAEKRELEVGQIITFWEQRDRVDVLNSHRIVEKIVHVIGDGSPDIIVYMTQGDNPKYGVDGLGRSLDRIVGVYQGKAPAIGKAIVWMQGSTGFLVCAVIPSGLVLIYCIVMVIVSAMGYKKVKGASTKEEVRAQLLEELKAEALKRAREEMQNSSAAGNGDNSKGDGGGNGDSDNNQK